MRITIKCIEYMFDNQYTHHHGIMMTLTSINIETKSRISFIEIRAQVENERIWQSESEISNTPRRTYMQDVGHQASAHDMHRPRRIGNILKYEITETFQFSILFQEIHSSGHTHTHTEHYIRFFH